MDLAVEDFCEAGEGQPVGVLRPMSPDQWWANNGSKLPALKVSNDGSDGAPLVETSNNG